MAKTDNIFTGIVRKKVGSLVGYRLTDSNNREKQGLRAYVANPSNPQTYAQARQRAKIAPAHAFFTAFEGALNHAFIPDGKVSANRNAFLSYAMSMDAVPHLKKGESGIPFLPYRISQGKNNLDHFCVCPWSDGVIADEDIPGYDDSDSLKSMFAGFFLPSEGNPAMSETASVAFISKSIINKNVGLQQGDQVSFLVLLDVDGVLQPVKIEFVLDPGDAVTVLGDLFLSQTNDKITWVDGSMGYFYLRSRFDPIVAAGCIITRNNGSSYVYSNSWMYVTGYGRANWAYDEQEVIESYMSKASLASSDKFLQQAKHISADSQPLSMVARDTATVSLVPGVTGTLSSQDAATVKYSNGHSKLVCIDGSPTTYNSSTGQYTKITLTPTGGEAAPLVLAQTWWGANADFVTPDEITL